MITRIEFMKIIHDIVLCRSEVLGFIFVKEFFPVLSSLDRPVVECDALGPLGPAVDDCCHGWSVS